MNIDYMSSEENELTVCRIYIQAEFYRYKSVSATDLLVLTNIELTDIGSTN